MFSFDKSIFNQKNSVIVGTWIFMIFDLALFITVICFDFIQFKYELTFVGLTFTTIIPLTFLLFGIKNKNSFNLLVFKILFYVYLVIVAIFVGLIDYVFGSTYLMINEKEEIDVYRANLMDEYQTEFTDEEVVRKCKSMCFNHILNITIFGILVLIYFIDSQNYVNKILKENDTIKSYRESIFIKKNKVDTFAPIFNSDIVSYGHQYGVNSCIVEIVGDCNNTDEKCQKKVITPQQPEVQKQNKIQQ